MAEIADRWIAASELGGPPTRRRAVAEGGDVWVETRLGPTRWNQGDRPGAWSTDRPAVGSFARIASDGQPGLFAGEREYRVVEDGEACGPNEFRVTADTIHLGLTPGEELPARLMFGMRVSNGEAAGGAWRIDNETRSGNGIAVWSGEREVLRCDIPAQSSLRVVTSLGRFAAAAELTTDRASSQRFRVLLDGVTLLDEVQSERDVQRVVALPEDGRTGAQLIFEVEGGFGRGLFWGPSIGPAEIGQYGDRPWRHERGPNIVLYVASSFRADNLSKGAIGDSLTPYLDALGDRSINYINARSVSSSTLPALASLLTGFFPGQHGAIGDGDRLAPDLTTVAEAFARRGYRTGAIVDAEVFSERHGLDQGFQWFVHSDGRPWSIRRSSDDADTFMDGDDGRPVFLVVQTCRASAPYRRGPAEDGGAWSKLEKRIENELAQTGTRGHAVRMRVRLGLMNRYRDLYTQGVRDLDRVLASFHRGVAERGVLERGYFIFTSDHGEALGENGALFHGGDLWDSRLRIPMLMSGNGLTPRRVDSTVSLIDLAPTLARLAGWAPPNAWMGQSLLADSPRSPVFAFQFDGALAQIAIIEDGRKAIANADPLDLAEGLFSRAYAISSDPGENENLATRSAWASDLCRRQADRVRGALAPCLSPPDGG